MAKRYVKNWYSIIPVYIGLTSSTTAQFRDGKNIRVSKHNYGEFREELFQHYLRDKGFSYAIQNGRVLVKTNNSISMYIQPDYSNVLDEIYLTKVYGDRRLDGRPVVDIGASIGDSALYFANLGASEIYGFEIDSKRYEIALENVRINDLTNIINIYNKLATSETIASLIHEKGLSELFLKLDCEGCEYEIISNLPDECFEKITDIVMEFHKSPRPIVKALSHLGYSVKTSKRFLVKEGLILATRLK